MLVSSIDEEFEGSLKIYQDAQISRIDLEKDSEFRYTLKSENHGLYIMQISGEIEVENELLMKRDTIEISDTKKINLKAKTISEVLLIEVPMEL